MGGYAAVEYCGGPSMIFRMGRIDAIKESDVAPENTLPVPQDDSPVWMEKAYRMGFTK